MLTKVPPRFSSSHFPGDHSSFFQTIGAIAFININQNEKFLPSNEMSLKPVMASLEGIRVCDVATSEDLLLCRPLPLNAYIFSSSRLNKIARV